jgi:uncharacterized protein (TIGR00730 family)
VLPKVRSKPSFVVVKGQFSLVSSHRNDQQALLQQREACFIIEAMQSVCVFLGSGLGNDPRLAILAQETGAIIAKRGFTLVYGGASVGLMGLLADAALQHGGQVVGIMPEALFKREVNHTKLTQFEVVDSMASRKTRMIERSDAFLTLPGGYGTLDECFEVLTLAQIGTHQKPSGLVNAFGFFDGLLAWVSRAEQDGLLRPQHRAMLHVGSDAGAVLDLLAAQAAKAEF